MKKRIVSLMLIATMILSMLAGCGDQNKETTAAPTDKETTASGTEAPGTDAPTDAPEPEVTYPLEGKPKLSIGITPNSNVTAVCSGWKETAMVKEWEKQTGVEIEFVEVKNINLLLAEKTLPDIILGWYGNDQYPGGWAGAIADKVVQPITDYYKEFAPDYAKLLEASPEEHLAWFDDELFGFAYILETATQASSSGIIIRQDWLDDLGLKAPTNHEELYTVLKAFKEKKGAEYPLGMSATQLFNNMTKVGMMASSFGFACSNYWVKDGVVQPCYIGDEYKAAVTFYNKLYNEGLLDPNCAALDSATILSNFLNGKSGVMFGAVASGMGAILEATKDDPNFKVTGIAPFETPSGDKAMSAQYTGMVQQQGAIITTHCKDIETACKFLNFGYTEAGLDLFNFGIEGTTYNVVDGKNVFIDEVVRNNPNMTIAQALAYYSRALIGGPFMQTQELLFQYNNQEKQIEALTNWGNADTGKYKLPTLVMSTDDATTYSNIMSDLNTYASESFAQFVTGKMSLDKWDEYEKQCETFGVLTATELNQKYYDKMFK